MFGGGVADWYHIYLTVAYYLSITVVCSPPLCYNLCVYVCKGVKILSNRVLKRIGCFCRFCYEKALCFLFSNRCACCSKIIPLGHELCESCDAELIRATGLCHKCGNVRSNCICKNRQFEFDSIYSPFIYDGVAKSGVYSLKSDGNRHSIRYFSEYMTKCVREHIPTDYFNCVVCVPMTRKQFFQKGFNHSYLLAKRISKNLGVPLCKSALKKLYETKAQHKCPGRRRRGNVFGVFEGKEHFVNGKRILLVDDVTTSRATLDECAKMLFIAGAKEVCCLVATVTQQIKRDSPSK